MEEVGTMNNQLHQFNNSQELTNTLCAQTIQYLRDAIETKGEASLLVSGGNTPKLLFDKLSLQDIQWNKVTIAPCDERWVEPNNENSNENLIKTHLLQNKASAANFIGMYHTEDIQNAQMLCSKSYQELMPFDVIILGMGEDGHTASLFPHNSKLKEAFDTASKNLTVCMKPQTAPYQRMSLNLKAILSASHIVLHIEGKKKFEVYLEALNSNDSAKMPISAVLNSDKTIEVYYK